MRYNTSHDGIAHCIKRQRPSRMDQVFLLSNLLAAYRVKMFRRRSADNLYKAVASHNMACGYTRMTDWPLLLEFSDSIKTLITWRGETREENTSCKSPGFTVRLISNTNATFKAKPQGAMIDRVRASLKTTLRIPIFQMAGSCMYNRINHNINNSISSWQTRNNNKPKPAYFPL